MAYLESIKNNHNLIEAWQQCASTKTETFCFGRQVNYSVLLGVINKKHLYMSNTFVIMDKLKALPPQLQDMVSIYIDFLAQQNAQISPTHKKRGGFGAWKGKITMAHDFDAPLDELKDYM